jgi:hypothetical protein
MAFPKLLQDPVLLTESIAVPILRVVEHEPCLIEDGYLVCVFELTTLVPSNDGLIDKGPVARKILNESYGLPVLVLIEYQAMSI